MNISQYIETGNYQKALQLVDELIDSNQKNDKILFTKATILYHLKKYKEAENIFMELYDKNKNSGILFYSMALVALELNQKEKAFYLLELAYLNGNDQSIYKIINLLFEKNGICDYANCKESCCKSVVLKGSDGDMIKDEQSFKRLISNPKQNNAWVKIGENKKNEWIFSCNNLGEGNFCKIHNSRSDACRDFPVGILSLKPVCSYYFRLSNELVKFRTKQTLAVVLDILEAYNYKKEKQIIMDFNENIK